MTHYFKKTLYFFAIMLLFFQQNSVAQSVKTIVDRDAILIGEPIQYKLLFSLPSNDYKVEFNVPDSFPHFEIQDQKKYDSTAKGLFFIVQDIKLTSWDSGQWVIPSFAVNVKSPAGNGSFNTENIKINVGYAPDDTQQLRDIKPVRDVLYIDRSWIIYAGILLAFLILLFFIIRYFVKKPKSKGLYSSRLSPYKEAMAALEGLRQTNKSTQEEVKIFYSKLGEIFKRYYSRKKRYNLGNKTTAETVATLQKMNAPSNVVSYVQEALETGDATKFAKYLPPAFEVDKCGEFVKEAISQLENISVAEPKENK